MLVLIEDSPRSTLLALQSIEIKILVDLAANTLGSIIKGSLHRAWYWPYGSIGSLGCGFYILWVGWGPISVQKVRVKGCCYTFMGSLIVSCPRGATDTGKFAHFKELIGITIYARAVVKERSGCRTWHNSSSLGQLLLLVLEVSDCSTIGQNQLTGSSRQIGSKHLPGAYAGVLVLHKSKPAGASCTLLRSIIEKGSEDFTIDASAGSKERTIGRASLACLILKSLDISVGSKNGSVQPRSEIGNNWSNWSHNRRSNWRGWRRILACMCGYIKILTCYALFCLHVEVCAGC